MLSRVEVLSEGQDRGGGGKSGYLLFVLKDKIQGTCGNLRNQQQVWCQIISISLYKPACSSVLGTVE